MLRSEKPQRKCGGPLRLASCTGQCFWGQLSTFHFYTHSIVDPLFLSYIYIKYISYNTLYVYTIYVYIHIVCIQYIQYIYIISHIYVYIMYTTYIFFQDFQTCFYNFKNNQARCESLHFHTNTLRIS